MPDHVHILLDVDPQFGVHPWLTRLKPILPVAATAIRWSKSLQRFGPTAISSRQWAERHSPLSSDTSRTRTTFECAAPQNPNRPEQRASPLPRSAIRRCKVRVQHGAGDQAALLKGARRQPVRPAPQASPRNRQASRRYGWLADFDAMSLQRASLNLDRAFANSLSTAPASPGSRASAGRSRAIESTGQTTPAMLPARPAKAAAQAEIPLSQAERIEQGPTPCRRGA
jgi:hypothetical protein